METNWAAEHLQTIRTLMERSALYRRALAPISSFVGAVGIVAALAGWALKIRLGAPLAAYWLVVAVVAIIGALLLVRRQAVKQGEDFWSPPTRRVVQAISPALLLGLLFGLGMIALSKGINVGKNSDESTALLFSLALIIAWTLLYGLALNAAGFFMPRGIRLFSWGFIAAGVAMVFAFLLLLAANVSPHLLMGILFGGSHLAYGVYLYFTEQRKNEA